MIIYMYCYLLSRSGRHSYTYTALRTSLENGEDDSDGEPTNAGTLPDDVSTPCCVGMEERLVSVP